MTFDEADLEDIAYSLRIAAGALRDDARRIEASDRGLQNKIVSERLAVAHRLAALAASIEEKGVHG